MVLCAMQLTAAAGVFASILAYAPNLIAQWRVLHGRLRTRIEGERSVNLGPWLGVALSFLWIYLANAILIQADVIVVGIFLRMWLFSGGDVAARNLSPRWQEFEL
jgi:hypothetical protein